MSDLTAKFTTLEEQLASEATTRQTTDDNIYALLGSMSDIITTINDNNATNTRLLLNAINASNACIDCGTVTTVTPPGVTDDNPVDDEHCQRVQAFLHAMELIYAMEDSVHATGIGFNPALMLSGLTETVDSIGNGATTPAPSYLEIVTLVADDIDYVVNNALDPHALSPLFADVKDALQTALFYSSSASDVKSAYDATIASEVSWSPAIPLMSQSAYVELVNLYFTPDSDVDLTGYDGTICLSGIPTGCVDIVSHYDAETNRQVIFLPVTWADFSVSWPGEGGNYVALFADAHPSTHIHVSPFVMDITYKNVGTNRFWFSREGDQYTLHLCAPA